MTRIELMPPLSCSAQHASTCRPPSRGALLKFARALSVCVMGAPQL